MGLSSNKHAKLIRGGSPPVIALVALLSGLTVLWLASPASASAVAPCAASLLRGGPEAAPRAPALSCAPGVRDARPARIAGTSHEAPLHSLHRSFFPARIMLTPRRLAANTVQGDLRVDRSETSPLDPALLIPAAWSDGAAPETRESPFTQVGNRAGLVNATQAEIQDDQVWLTAGPTDDEAALPALAQTAAP